MPRSRRGGLALLAGGAVLAWLLLRRGEGVGTGKRARRRPTPRPATEIRLDARGIVVDGAPSDIDRAVAKAKLTGAARITVTGDARHGAVAELREALRAAGVTVRSRS